jgi:hypothetical protein
MGPMSRTDILQEHTEERRSRAEMVSWEKALLRISLGGFVQ